VCGNNNNNNNKAWIEQALEAVKFKAPSEKYNKIDSRHIRTTADHESLSWYNAPTPFATAGTIGDTENLEPSLTEQMETSSTEVLDAASDEEPVTPPLMSLMDVEQDFLELDLWSDHETTTMRRLIGEVNLAAIFVIDRVARTERQAQDEELELQDVTEMLRTEKIHPPKLIQHLSFTWPLDQGLFYFRSLKAFATAANIYKLLPNATVELKTISQTIGIQRWIPDLSGGDFSKCTFIASTKLYERAFEAPEAFNLGRAQTLACLAMFENGTMNIRPSVLENVMAIATGSSIYVPSSLVYDPLEAPRQHELARIIGNIGKPGVALLRRSFAFGSLRSGSGEWLTIKTSMGSRRTVSPALHYIYPSQEVNYLWMMSLHTAPKISRHTSSRRSSRSMSMVNGLQILIS
jgi:hypothetical protein